MSGGPSSSSTPSSATTLGASLAAPPSPSSSFAVVVGRNSTGCCVSSTPSSRAVLLCNLDEVPAGCHRRRRWNAVVPARLLFLICQPHGDVDRHGEPRVAAAEIAVLASLVAVAALRSGRDWWASLLVDLPLVGVETWFDTRSCSHWVVPEVYGVVGVASVAVAIPVAGGAGWAAGAVPLAAVPAIGFVGVGSLWWLCRPPPSITAVGVVEVAVVGVTGLNLRVA